MRKEPEQRGESRVEPERRPADAVLKWPVRSEYSGALADNFAAREFLLSNGLCFHGDVFGVLHGPQFRDQETPALIPDEWIDQEGWQTKVSLWWGMEWGKQKVLGLTLPEGVDLAVGHREEAA